MNKDKKAQAKNLEIERLVLGTPAPPEEPENLIEEIELASKTPSQKDNFETSDFQSLNENQVFSKQAYYKLLNKNTGHVFYINGRDLEGKIGLDNVLYNKVKSRKEQAFKLGNHIVAFYKLCNK